MIAAHGVATSTHTNRAYGVRLLVVAVSLVYSTYVLQVLMVWGTSRGVSSTNT